MKTLARHLTVADSNFQMSEKEQKSILPEKKSRLYRMFKHPLMMPYNRLAVFAALCNLLYFLNQTGIDSKKIMDLGLLNFSVAVLIRQQYVINALFAVATKIPLHWPLAIRWAAGKVYHFGGIHVGCFFSGSLWYALFLNQSFNEGTLTKTLQVLGLFHLSLLVGLMIVSLPVLRSQYHNFFERTARFGNWISLGLFWVQANLITTETNLTDTKEFWILGLLSFLVLLPWLRLKKVPVKWLRPSSHVGLAEFDYGVTPFAGSSTELSLSPLLEWHSFANVPSPHKPGYRLTISRAGDWTGKLIEDLPKEIWVKGIPTAGVGNIETLFRKVIWIATGSGIGPCLPHLLSQKVPSRLVWSTRNPEKTYGHELVNEIRSVQSDAVIWDTDLLGKPNLVELAYKAYKEFGAEAVICISNKKVTWEVVYELESRGIPAFGAIWDS